MSEKLSEYLDRVAKSQEHSYRIEEVVSRVRELEKALERATSKVAAIENDCNTILQHDENDAVCEFANDILDYIEEKEIGSQEAGNWESK